MNVGRVSAQMPDGPVWNGPFPRPSATGNAQATGPVTGLVPLSGAHPGTACKIGDPARPAAGRLARLPVDLYIASQGTRSSVAGACHNPERSIARYQESGDRERVSTPRCTTRLHHGAVPHLHAKTVSTHSPSLSIRQKLSPPVA